MAKESLKRFYFNIPHVLAGDLYKSKLALCLPNSKLNYSVWPPEGYVGGGNRVVSIYILKVLPSVNPTLLQFRKDLKTWLFR